MYNMLLLQLTIVFSLLSSVVFLIGRFIFYYSYTDKNERYLYSEELFSIYKLALKFDLKVIATVNVLPVVCSIFSHVFQDFAPVLYACCFVYFSVMLLIFLLCFIIDYFFYSYFGDRINYLIWGIVDDDIKALFKTICKHFHPLISLAGIAIFFFLIISLVKILSLISFFPVLLSHLSFMTLWGFLITTNFLLARGNIRHMPLSLKHATVSAHAFLNKLSCNPMMLIFAVIKLRKQSKKQKSIVTPFNQNFEKIKKVLGTESDATTINELLAKKSRYFQQSSSPHVVVIMMESFGSQFLIEDDDAHTLLGSLGSHFNQDLVFYNFLSGANGTAESFCSLVGNTMMLPCSNALTESKYLGEFLPSSVASLYKKAGYETVAVYGGALSWRNIGKFLESQQFDCVYGDQSIISELGLDRASNIGNEWGVYDEYLFDFVRRRLDKSSAPQFVMVLSTTNHPPFSTVPSHQFTNNEIVDKYKQRFFRSSEAEQRFKVYEYSNDVVGTFLSKVKDSKLANKTIIAITGDHAFRGYRTNESHQFLKLAVPFYLYAPSAILNKDCVDVSKFGSHKDIIPTLIDLSLPEAVYYSIGSSMLSNVESGVSFNSKGVVANKNGLAMLGANDAFYELDCESLRTKITKKNAQLESLLNQYYASIDASKLFLKL